ncbi:DUF4136 domain-containing protein [Emcibacter nanhaiensis]|uniref:DUF4136 domain-containing protein n=1 Tax=Emcibacter nanhaiensis TaxID=1505037 RepID=A0A501PBV1_9PROT|nr:DUF4136 domain-containing protein [Emcibacter nanhaiensis]TPD57456.1 DUF4136 domain-containing protein [Emcibacter nanhaiensis]
MFPRPARFLVLLFPLLLALLFSGCASTVSPRVSRFHQLPPAANQTITVEPRDPALANSLEFSNYADMIGQKLTETGYLPPATSKSDLRAWVHYSVRHLSKIEEEVKPVSGHVTVGGGNRGTYTDVGINVNLGDRKRTETDSVFSLRLEIERTSDGLRLYEGTSSLRAKNKTLNQVMPWLVDALFTDFPGQSGSSGKVRVEK